MIDGGLTQPHSTAVSGSPDLRDSRRSLTGRRLREPGTQKPRTDRDGGPTKDPVDADQQADEPQRVNPRPVIARLQLVQQDTAGRHGGLERRYPETGPIGGDVNFSSSFLIIASIERSLSTTAVTQQPNRLFPQLGVVVSTTSGHSPPSDAPWDRRNNYCCIFTVRPCSSTSGALVRTRCGPSPGSCLGPGGPYDKAS